MSCVSTLSCALHVQYSVFFQQNLILFLHSVTCILFTGIIFVVAVFVTIAALVNSLHRCVICHQMRMTPNDTSSTTRVKEGNVAIYFSNGALLDDITGPGVHWSTPFVTIVHQVFLFYQTFYNQPSILKILVLVINLQNLLKQFIHFCLQ